MYFKNHDDILTNNYGFSCILWILNYIYNNLHIHPIGSVLGPAEDVLYFSLYKGFYVTDQYEVVEKIKK